MGGREVERKGRERGREVLTVLQPCILPASSLRASITISPAMIALVVAIAGMILPAIATREKKVYQTLMHDLKVISKDGLLNSILPQKRNYWL